MRLDPLSHLLCGSGLRLVPPSHLRHGFGRRPVGAVSAAYASYALPFTYSGLDSESTPADILDKLGSPNSSINLSSDVEGTIIELIYSRTVKEDDVSTDINLLIDLKYDVAKNNATMSSIDITSISYKSE